MNPTVARAKAERCFAVARSTTFDGERESAISRGKAICEAAGLSLDLFDIPGRVRSTDTARPGRRPTMGYTAEEAARMARDLNEQIRAAMAGAYGNSPFGPAAAAAEAELRQRRDRIKRQTEERLAILAAQELSRYGFAAVRFGDEWSVAYAGKVHTASHSELVELSRAVRAAAVRMGGDVV